MDRKDKYIYPAIFDCGDDGITITFSDFPGCISEGEKLHEPSEIPALARSSSQVYW